jgi:hypothetical protein
LYGGIFLFNHIMIHSTLWSSVCSNIFHNTSPSLLY